MNIQEKQEKEKRRKNQTKQDQHPEGEKVGYLFIRLLLQRDFLPPATSPALCSATTPRILPITSAGGRNTKTAWRREHN